MTTTILIGDVREQLRTLADNSVHCIITSPPYWGLRDYGMEGQIGLEASPADFIVAMVEVFEDLRRVLRPDGTCWMNMGDSYASKPNGPAGAGGHKTSAPHVAVRTAHARRSSSIPAGFKHKDLCMMPHRVAIALQDAGWYVRQDIVWSKPNPMPESVRDRCTKSHEYIFLLTKSAQYYYDADAIKEPVAESTVSRLAQDVESQGGSERVPGKTNGAMKAVRSKRDSFKREGSKREQAIPGQGAGTHRPSRAESEYSLDMRNKRSVWEITTQPFSDAHFATFPPELPETCIKAGCPPGGIVLDPFFGAGTTGLVADRMQRDCIGIELNPAYAEIARRRIEADSPLLADVRLVMTAQTLEAA